MKLERKIKKFLSGLLTGALIITGSSIGAPSYAAETSSVPSDAGSMESFEVSMTYYAKNWVESATEQNPITITGNGEYEISYTAQNDSDDIFMLWLDTNLYNTTTTANFNIKPTQVQVEDTAYDLNNGSGYMAFSDFNFDNNIRINIRNPYNELVAEDLATPISEEYADSLLGTVAPVTAGDTITVRFMVSGMDPEADTFDFSTLTPEPTITSATTSTPTPTSIFTLPPDAGNMESFEVSMTYYSMGWDEYAPEQNPVTVTGNGEYEISYTAQIDSDDIFMLWLDTNLYNTSFPKDFSIQPTEVCVDDTSYTLLTGSGYMLFQDCKYTNALRINIRNEYNCLIDETLGHYLNKTPADSFDGTTVPVSAGDTITVKFTVSGMDPEADTFDFSTLTPEPTPTFVFTLPPDTGNMASFEVNMTYYSMNWDECATEQNPITVIGNGEYEISYTAQNDSDDIFMLWLDTNLYNTSFPKDFSIQPTEVCVDDTSYTLLTGSGYMLFQDCDYTDALRINIRNKYNCLIDETLGHYLNKTPADSFDGTTVPISAGDTITVKFTVSGMDPEAETFDFTSLNDPIPETTSVPEETPFVTPDPGNSVTPEETPSSTKTPVVMRKEGNMNEFDVDIAYASNDWKDQTWEGNAISVTSDGTYEISYTALKDVEDIFLLILDTNLHNGSTPADFMIQPTQVQVEDMVYTVAVQVTPDGSHPNNYMLFADYDYDNQLRVNIRNEYNSLVGEDLVTPITNDKVDAFNGTTIPVKAGDKITVTFTVSGMDPEAETITYEKKDDSNDDSNDSSLVEPTIPPEPDSGNTSDSSQTGSDSLSTQTAAPNNENPIVTQPPSEEEDSEEDDAEEDEDEELFEDGDTITYSGSEYEILSVEDLTVAYYEPENKKVKQVTIPKKITVKENGEKISFKVVAISEDAFSGCSKLKTINIKSTTIKKVGKNALKGVYLRCKIKVPKKKYIKYKKLFANKGQRKTVKVVKG